MSMNLNPVLPELQLTQIPASARGDFLGDRLSYMEAGDPAAFPVVLLHGIGANSSHWRFQFKAFANDYRVIAWNAPGYYLSDNFVAETPTGQDYAQALKYLADSLQISRFHLVGNSFGSQVGSCFTSLYPDYVQSVAFTGTSIGRGWLTPAEKEQTATDRLEQIGSGAFRFGSERWQALLSPNANPDTIALVQNVLRMTHPDGFLRAVRFGLTLETLKSATDWRKPLLIIQGENDIVTPFAHNGAKLAEKMPDCRVEHLAGAGHLPEFEVPDLVNPLLRDHFSQQAPS